MKYPEYVYEEVCKRLDIGVEEVDTLSNEEVFEALVAWNLGHNYWADIITAWVRDVYNIELARQ